MPYSAKNGKMTAFKPGFRMLAGDPMSKKNNRISICHRCLGNGEGFAPCDSKDTGELPTKYCPSGIRATIIFPSCWDGVNLDSPDHKSHVAYSNSGGLGSTNCPSTHPVAIPQVMYEVMWDTGRYKNTAWYGNGKQPFVYSFGDGWVLLNHALIKYHSDIDIMIGLDTVSMVITYLDGKATLCKRLWMPYLAASARMPIATSLKYSLLRIQWIVRRRSKWWKM